MESNTVSKLLEQATAQHEAACFAEAEKLYQQILTIDAQQGEALQSLGILNWQLAQLDSALSYLMAAVAAQPDNWRYSYTLGRFFAANGQTSEAIMAFDQAKNLSPDSVVFWFELGKFLHGLGKLEDAVFAYQQTIKLQADHIDAYNNLGVVLDAQGQFEAAMTVFQQGLALRPDFAPLYNNLGNTSVHLGWIAKALTVFQQGLEICVDGAELWFNYANALAQQAASLEAAAAYQQALVLHPQHIKALVNLANLLRLRGEKAAALALYTQAIALAPDFYDAYNNAGVCLLALGRLDEASSMLEKAIVLDPIAAVAHNNLGNVYKDAGKLDAAIASFRRAVSLDPENTEAYSNLFYTLSFHPEFDAQSILAEAKQFAHICTTPSIYKNRRQASTQQPNRRLRIGYVSPDFREHCQSLFTVPLLGNHDHNRFEIYCYAQLAQADEISLRLASYADEWRLTYGQTDAQLAEIIMNDQVDILVDLTMHMAGGRPMLFARKPAPVQIAWLAYPGTTGLAAIDHRLTDFWLDPPELGDACYAETSIRLPDTFWCYDPLLTGLLPNPLPALRAGYVTFGCLNNFCKVSDDTLERWGRIMARLANSRLILLAAVGQHRQLVYDLLGQYGISANRIEFVSYRPRQEYLQTYQRIDLCLDTLPYNGHTTSLDAYWMGVPVVTQVGATVVGRAGWSQLNNLGLPELAAFDEEAFVEIAVSLASDLPRLSQLRKTLRGRLQASPLMDGKRFAGAIESVYWQTWQEWSEKYAKVDASTIT